ncbi:MAG: hypothetical protein RJS97_08865 [Parvibaculaceae bacterium]
MLASAGADERLHAAAVQRKIELYQRTFEALAELEGPPAVDAGKQSLVMLNTPFEELEKFIVWGKPSANGLQAGVVFDPLRNRYSTIDTLRVRLFIRTSKEDSSQSVPSVLEPDQVEARFVDQRGAEFSVTAGPHWAFGKSFSALRMPDGGPIVIDRLEISVEKPTEILFPSIRIADVEGWGWIARLKGGQQYHLSFTIPSFGDKDGVPLETGSLSFDVVETRQSRPARIGLLDRLDQTNRLRLEAVKDPNIRKRIELYERSFKIQSEVGSRLRK